MVWAIVCARTKERRASSELVMPGRRSSTVSAVNCAIVMPAWAQTSSK
jgi:hypothetical protein